VTSATSTTAELGRIASLGNLLGVDTARLLGRLGPFAAECGKDLRVTMPHSLDSLTATTHVTRERAATVCGRWLDDLAGDRLELVLGATTTAAFSDEAALPADAPPVLEALGGDLASVGHDGSGWTYIVEHANGDETAEAATLARIDAVAQALGVTESQRKIAAGLHRSLARRVATHAALRGRTLSLIWDRVEWQPIQSMLSGFHPGTPVGQLPRIARTVEADEATVELLLGPKDPPALRLTLRLA
jgi:hypothetical protein